MYFVKNAKNYVNCVKYYIIFYIKKGYNMHITKKIEKIAVKKERRNVYNFSSR